MPAEFKKEPTIIEKKVFNPKDHMTEEQIKKLEDGVEENNTLSIGLEEQQPAVETNIE